jgi:hypothetical protein
MIFEVQTRLKIIPVLREGMEVVKKKLKKKLQVLKSSKNRSNKTEKSFSNLAASQFCFSRSNKSTTTLQF